MCNTDKVDDLLSEGNIYYTGADIRAKLASAGFVLVPRQPTAEVLDALYGLQGEQNGDTRPALRLWEFLVSLAVTAP